MLGVAPAAEPPESTQERRACTAPLGGTTLASIMGGARRLDGVVRPLTGLIFLLVGINEIILYWLAV